MIRALPLLLLPLAACGDVTNPDNDHEGELITTVVLAFAPTAGDTLTFTWDDPEGDGDPVIDDIVLDDATAYTTTVRFWNRLAQPEEDLTPEIADESDQHQVFFTGDAVSGPATGANAEAILEHAYADTDADGLPVGLENTVTTLQAGSGELVITLQHLPPEDGQPVKRAGLAESIATDGFGGVGGDSDARVTFAVEVR